MRKGLFVVIDGNDGSGKATQARLLCERFIRENALFEKLDFPRYDHNFFGGFIGECLAGMHGDFVHLNPKIASVLYALDRLETTPHIKGWLDAGKMVIADRFTSANQIHQGGKVVDAAKRAAFFEWLHTMEHEVLGIPRPDAVIYLRVPVDVSLTLLAKKRDAKNSALGADSKDMVEKDRMYLERSVESAERLAAMHDHWHQIDCVKEGVMRSPEEIHDELYAIVARLRQAATTLEKSLDTTPMV